MQERRQIDRKYLAIYSRVFDRGTGQVLGYLADLSQKGAMLISDNPILEGGIFNLRFDLPDPAVFLVDHLDLQARSAWCNPDIDPSFHNIGFEFLHVSEQDSRILADMIQSYRFNSDLPDYPNTSFSTLDF